MGKLAIVLFNLGGPDSPAAVKPFLFNLFKDPAIIGAPGPIRLFLAWLISTRRAPIARAIYDRIGGKSPLLETTRAQASALEELLGPNSKVFIAMRYWHPFTEEAVNDVRAWKPDRIVLLPLYPQYSTTTSRSSLEAWHKEAARQRLTTPTSEICCYPTEAGLISALADLVNGSFQKLWSSQIPDERIRILFSAHGLPKKIIEKGDPYQQQIEKTAQAVAVALNRPQLDWVVCYQSRVGPLEWIGPSTDDEIKRAGAEGKSLVVVPIAFVSEHSETLVELDLEYAHLAREVGVPDYVRTPTVGTHPDFIKALEKLVNESQLGVSGRSLSFNKRACTNINICGMEKK